MIDEFTRECLVLKADRGITSADVIDSLAELFAMRGVPKHIRSDNGPEFIANELRAWLDRVGVSTLYIEPGSPWENGFAESFHSRFRDECLALEVFDGLRDARAITAAWKDDYNHRRPHGSLGFQTPAGFAAACAASTSDTASLLPHTRLFAWVTPNPEPSYRLVQETQAGQGYWPMRDSGLATTATKSPNPIPKTAHTPSPAAPAPPLLTPWRQVDTLLGGPSTTKRFGAWPPGKS
jgi:hypothetical protein